MFDNSCNQAGKKWGIRESDSWEIFTNFLKKNFEMKFLNKIFEVFVVNRQSSYVKARPTH